MLAGYSSLTRKVFSPELPARLNSPPISLKSVDLDQFEFVDSTAKDTYDTKGLAAFGAFVTRPNHCKILGKQLRRLEALAGAERPMPIKTFDPGVTRYHFEGYNRHGVRVWQLIDAATPEDAKRTLREQGYRIERIWQAFDWRHSPAVWVAGAVSLLILLVAFLIVPLVGVAVTISLTVIAAAALERHRRNLYKSNEQRLRIAVVQSQQAHLRVLENRRQREEVLLDLAVQRIVHQLSQRRNEAEATLMQLEVAEDTLIDFQTKSGLLRQLDQKRAEIAKLESELQRMKANA